MVSATIGLMPVYSSIADSTAERLVSASRWPSFSARRNAATVLGWSYPLRGSDVAGEREALQGPLVEVGDRHRAELLLGGLGERLRQPGRVHLPGRQHGEQRGETALGHDLLDGAQLVTVLGEQRAHHHVTDVIRRVEPDPGVRLGQFGDGLELRA